MLTTNIDLHIFSKASNFYFTIFRKLFLSIKKVTTTRLLLFKPNTNYITKKDLYFKCKFKLKFIVYNILKIVQQLITIAKLIL